MSEPEHSTRLRRLIRRVTRPISSPLDGRVADVNRRITDSHDTAKQVREKVGAVHGELRDVRRRLAEMTGELGAYATASVESAAYLGTEMRRLEDFLKEQESNLLERIDLEEQKRYVERLNRATRLSLDHLDGAVANLVNHANGHRGFAAQAGLWFNPAVTVELEEGHARLAGVNERVAELPFAFGALARLEPPAKILDIGGAESTFSLSAASLGYVVTTIDLHPMPFSHPNLECVVARFEDWEPNAGGDDAVFLISTIEHFGLGAYGEAAGSEEADRLAISRVRDLLNDGGFLVLTTPYGPAKMDALERTYDDAGLAALLSGWNVSERRILKQLDELTWIAADEGQDMGKGVALLVATPDR